MTKEEIEYQSYYHKQYHTFYCVRDILHSYTNLKKVPDFYDRQDILYQEKLNKKTIKWLCSLSDRTLLSFCKNDNGFFRDTVNDNYSLKMRFRIIKIKELNDKK